MKKLGHISFINLKFNTFHKYSEVSSFETVKFLYWRCGGEGRQSPASHERQSEYEDVMAIKTEEGNLIYCIICSKQLVIRFIFYRDFFNFNLASLIPKANIVKWIVININYVHA